MKERRGVPLPLLREWREWRGLTQDELKKASGVTVGTISRIEQGLPARLDTVRRLAEALTIGREELMRKHPQPGDRPALAIA
jgi:transcriptional regulator with XRE-family HTH domain